MLTTHSLRSLRATPHASPCRKIGVEDELREAVGDREGQYENGPP